MPQTQSSTKPSYAELGRIVLAEHGEPGCAIAYGTVDPFMVGHCALAYGDIERDGTLT